MINDLQHTTLALTWSDWRLDRLDPINRQVMSIPCTYVYPDRTFKSALGSCSQRLSFKVLEGGGWGQLRWENRNLTSAENLNGSKTYPQLGYTGRVSPS